MRQLLIFSLLLTTFPLHGICFTANERARHFISNLLEDHGLKNRTKRQTRVKSQFPVVPSYWRHAPNSPQFNQLINQLSQIIPGQAVEARLTIFSNSFLQTISPQKFLPEDPKLSKHISSYVRRAMLPYSEAVYSYWAKTGLAFHVLNQPSLANDQLFQRPSRLPRTALLNVTISVGSITKANGNSIAEN